MRKKLYETPRPLSSISSVKYSHNTQNTLKRLLMGNSDSAKPHNILEMVKMTNKQLKCLKRKTGMFRFSNPKNKQTRSVTCSLISFFCNIMLLWFFFFFSSTCQQAFYFSKTVNSFLRKTCLYVSLYMVLVLSFEKHLIVRFIRNFSTAVAHAAQRHPCAL